MSRVPTDSSLRNVPVESKVDLEIVKIGVVYTEMDAFRQDAVETYFATRVDEEDVELDSETKDPQSVDFCTCTHPPLQGSQDIRVLELYPGDFTDELSCALHICSVDFEYSASIDESTGLNFAPYTNHAVFRETGQLVWYTALSYVWGDATLIMPINCNGLPIYTTRNLDIALRHLRQTDVAVMLWIDQICINQEDLDEKSRQVILMSKIYQRAWSTIVWLGEEAHDSDNAMDTLRTINEALQYYTDERAPDPEDFERLSLPAPDSQEWAALSQFLDRPWFQRVWVIQEVVLSNNIQVVCGNKTLPWSDIGLFAICMVTHDLTRYLNTSTDVKGPAIETGYRHILRIDSIKDHNDTLTEPLPLLQTLVEARGARATDPRDNVFGVMGMSSTLIYPDYSQAIFDVYTEAARTMVTDRLMNLLCCVDNVEPLPGLPSWAPDWSSARQTTSFGYLEAGRGIYQVAKGSKLSFSIGQNRDSLIIDGILFDTVTCITEVANPSLQDLLDAQSPASQFVAQGLYLATAYCGPYPAPCGLFDAFWLTLVAGKDHSGKTKAPADYAPIFALLIDSITGYTPSFPDQPSAQRKLTLENLKTRRPGRMYREIQIAFEIAVQGRRFGTTANRYMGLFPRGTRAGDEICVFAGPCVPFVVRPVEGEIGVFQLVGECYVHGIMRGEIMSMDDFEMQGIELV